MKTNLYPYITKLTIKSTPPMPPENQIINEDVEILKFINFIKKIFKRLQKWI